MLTANYRLPGRNDGLPGANYRMLAANYRMLAANNGEMCCSFRITYCK
ncbi:hypothetical protein [Alloprevotella tannerae]|nr:hypothetical protein [Alloprevotella tannerae]